MGLDAAFRGHEGRVGEDDVGEFVPALLGGEGVVFVDVGVGEAMQVEVHQGEPHHVGRDIVALEVLGEASAVVGRELAVALGVGVRAEDVLVGGDEEAGGAAGGVEDLLSLLRGEDFHHEINDVPGRAELPGIALRAEDAQQILEGVSEPLAVVVAELIYDLQEGLERLGIAIRQVSVFEDVAKERRDAVVLRHLRNAFRIKAEHLVPAERGSHELCPAVTGEWSREKGSLTARQFRGGVHVIHELVDQRDGDLLDLGFGIGDFADEDVAGGVDAAFGIGVEH